MQARCAVTLLVLIGAGCATRDERSGSADTPRTTSDTAGAHAERWVVDAGGIGRVRTGMSLAQLSTLLGTTVRASYQYNESCDYVRPAGLPPGVSLMVLSDTVRRVDVDSAGVLTTEGAGVGDTESSVLQLYRGRVRVEPHKYTGPKGHYLIVASRGDSLRRIIFETDGEHVQNFRAGSSPAVDYVEGCS